MITKDKKIPMTVSISLRTSLGLDRICQADGLIRSRLIEDLLQQYIGSWLQSNPQRGEEEF